MTERQVSCHSRLRPVTGARLPDATSVRYSASDTLLVIDPTDEQVGILGNSDWPGEMVILSPRGGELEPGSGSAAARVVAGSAQSIEGWLGRYQVRAADRNDKALTGLSPKPNGTFDMIIDCRSQPLLDAPVARFGYFRAGSLGQLQDSVIAARQLIGNFEKPKYFDYQLEICAHHSYGQTGCTRCLDVCGADAIRSGGHQIEINPYLCQDCGSCTLACPTGALSFVEPDRASLLARVHDLAPNPEDNERAPTLIVHDGSVDGPDPVGTAQLGVQPLTAFGEELWIAALALGFGRVVLQTAEPMEPRSRDVLARRLSDAQRMLPVLGLPPGAVALVGPDFQPNDGSPTPEGIDPARSAIPGAGAILQGESAQPPSKRPLLNAGLDALQSASANESAASLNPGAPMGEILVDTTRCTLCSSCAKLCPTGAIDYSEREQPGTAHLTFLEANCVQCGICVSGCPEQAITLWPRLASKDVRRQRRVVASSPMAECGDCGAQFVAQTLLDSTVRRLRENGATEAVLEQAVRCPQCRAVRVG